MTRFPQWLEGQNRTNIKIRSLKSKKARAKIRIRDPSRKVNDIDEDLI